MQTQLYCTSMIKEQCRVDGCGLAVAAVITAAAMIFGDLHSGAPRECCARLANTCPTPPLCAIPFVRSSPSFPPAWNPSAHPPPSMTPSFSREILFIAGPSGLTKYDGSTAVIAARYRVGAELPPAPITSLAIGLAGDSSAPELWIGTWGEGLAAFDGRSSFRHLRPDDARLRKIAAILPVDTGRLLIGTEKAGVLVYDGHSLAAFHPSVAEIPVHCARWKRRQPVDRHPRPRPVALESRRPRYPSTTCSPTSKFSPSPSPEKPSTQAQELASPKFVEASSPASSPPDTSPKPCSPSTTNSSWETLEDGMFAVPLDAHPGRQAQLGTASICTAAAFERSSPSTAKSTPLPKIPCGETPAPSSPARMPCSPFGIFRPSKWIPPGAFGSATSTAASNPRRQWRPRPAP